MMLCSGIGSAPGLSGPRSHASVHTERSCRAGFPVRPFERIASREDAAIIFSRKISEVSDSTVASHTEPVQAPAAPIAMQAAIWCPVMMPPAASTGTSRIGLIALITSGTSTMVDTSPQCPPASVPCATKISTPAATCRSACSLEPTSAATGTPCLRPLSIIAVGDVARRQFDAVFLQEISGEVAVLRRDPRLQAFPGDVLFACGRDVLGDQH